MAELILASSSPYRKQLLERLNLPFECISPDVDERVLANESPSEMVIRLARLKGLTVAERHPEAIIIASDQCLALQHSNMADEIMGKPGDFDRAFQQLKQASGKPACFFTSIFVCHLQSGFQQIDQIPVEVSFRELADDEINRYLLQDEPYDCAGSFRSERLGISLLENMHCPDPSALIGLPLIRLSQMLRQTGLVLP